MTIGLDATFGDVKVTKTSTTTKEEGSTQQVRHTWVFDLTGCTVKALVDEAIGKVVIGLQDRVRRHWKKHGSVPSDLPAGKVTIKVADLLAGRAGAIVPTVESVSAALEALTPEQRAKVLEMLKK